MLIDINSFISFLDENHIIATIVATVNSSYITNLSNSLTNDILLPIINRDGDGDGESDIKKYEDLTLNIYNIKFRIGNFIIEGFKFLFMTYLMFLISRAVKDKK